MAECSFCPYMSSSDTGKLHIFSYLDQEIDDIFNDSVQKEIERFSKTIFLSFLIGRKTPFDK